MVELAVALSPNYNSEETTIPTLSDHLMAAAEEYFGQPDVIERTKPIQAFWKAFCHFGEHAAATLLYLAECPPSPGYEPWLIEHGCSTVIARWLAGLIVRWGKLVAEDDANLSSAADAIRFLARPSRRPSAASRKARVLLLAWQKTSVLEDVIFDGTDLDVFEFVRLLEMASAGQNAAHQRLQVMAASLTAHLSVRRGPKVNAASAAHEFFLEKIVFPMKGPAYTWDAIKEDFTDPVTEATRREFDDPDFDPRPARRRLMARN